MIISRSRLQLAAKGRKSTEQEDETENHRERDGGEERVKKEKSCKRR